MNSIVVLLCLSAAAMAAEDKAFYFIAAPRLEEVNPQQISDNVMAQLKQLEGSDSGVYHVYLPDGRLQRVQYTTAPLEKSQEVKKETETPSKKVPVYKGVKTVPLPLDNFADEKQDEKSNYEEAPKNYVASIAYTNIQPIPGPIYAYNPKPVARNVRYAPQF